MLAVLLDQIGEGLFVDLADIGRDVVERRIATELIARCGSTVLVVERLLGIVALEGERRSGVAP